VVLQENPTSLDPAAEFAAKSSGCIRTLPSSNFWFLILVILHLGVSVLVLSIYEVIQCCRTFQ